MRRGDVLKAANTDSGEYQKENEDCRIIVKGLTRMHNFMSPGLSGHSLEI